MSLQIKTKIEIIGVNPYVEVPEDVLKNLFMAVGKDKGPIPVKGLINGQPYTQTVVKYAGLWRLYVNGPMMKAAAVEIGDMVTVEIEYDPLSRAEPIPALLAAEFDAHPELRQTFNELAPHRQKEMLRYLNSAKTEETLRRNVEKAVRFLSGDEKDSLVAFTRRKNEG